MTARLTDEERRDRAMTEAELEALIIDPTTGLAPMLGWETLHVGALKTSQGLWRTPTRGSMAKGWPDLTLVRIRDRRLIFAELKSERGVVSPAQWDVLRLLGALAGEYERAGRVAFRVDTAVWRPSDLHEPVESSVIYRDLR